MRFLDKLKGLKGTKHVIDFEEYSENGTKILRMALRRNVTVEVKIAEPWVRIKLEGSFPFKRCVRVEVVNENGLSAWTNPVKMEFEMFYDDLKIVSYAVSNDFKYLVFTGKFSGGIGGDDLMISKYNDKTKKWGRPRYSSRNKKDKIK